MPRIIDNKANVHLKTLVNGLFTGLLCALKALLISAFITRKNSSFPNEINKLRCRELFFFPRSFVLSKLYSFLIN